MSRPLLIERYRPEMAPEWDRFVSHSRQPSFLFSRAYMDYHADRFGDYSLVARRGHRITALLPAERYAEGKRRSIVTSHRGLTYGGWITPKRHFNGTTMLEVMEAAIDFMRTDGVERLIYTPLPHIYAMQPAEEDIYALFRLGAAMTGCGLSSAINLRSPSPSNESTRQAVKLALNSRVEIEESDDFTSFWTILEECLAERHEAVPTHSLAEMHLLRERFPRNIRLFMARIDNLPVAGAVIYLTPRVAHVQYMATTAPGRATKALALLISRLKELYTPTHDYLDFGVSTEAGGTRLNHGLLLQKSGHGALGIATPTFTLQT